jgi:hypothetical protein
MHHNQRAKLFEPSQFLEGFSGHRLMMADDVKSRGAQDRLE